MKPQFIRLLEVPGDVLVKVENVSKLFCGPLTGATTPQTRPYSTSRARPTWRPRWPPITEPPNSLLLPGRAAGVYRQSQFLLRPSPQARPDARCMAATATCPSLFATPSPPSDLQLCRSLYSCTDSGRRSNCHGGWLPPEPPSCPAGTNSEAAAPQQHPAPPGSARPAAPTPRRGYLSPASARRSCTSCL